MGTQKNAVGNPAGWRRNRLTGRWAVVLGTLGVLGIATAPIEAALYEFTFGGEIDEIAGVPLDPWADIDIGSMFFVTYVFDSETPDLASQNNFGVYDVLSFSVTIDGITLAADSAHIQVENFGLDDRYYVQFAGLPVGIGANGNVHLNDFGAISSDDLLLDIDLDDWQFRRFELGGSFHVAGLIDTFSSRIVPSPASLPALMLGIALHRHRRRKC